MKLFFTKKNFMQKIIICIVMVLLVNFTLAPTYSHAGLEDDLGNIFFNVLLRVGDAAVWIVQRVVYGLENSFIKIDRSTDWKNVVGGILAGIGAIAIVVGVTIASYGTATVPTIAAIIGGGIAGAAAGGHLLASASKDEMMEVAAGGVPKNLYLPVAILSPEYIFSNKLGLTDVNFFKPTNASKGMYKDPETGEQKEVYYIDANKNGKVDTQEMSTLSTAAALRDSITKWYYAIRNLALVGLLSVLVYVGIRIIISSSTTEKAKYKSMITDWVVAICLVMILHYIMVFAITIVEKITIAISNSGQSEAIWYKIDDKDTLEAINDQCPELLADSKSGALEWPVNLLGAARMEAQFLSVYDETKATISDDSANIDVDQTLRQKMSYTIIYLALVFFTIYFLFYYVKRVIYLAFLTLIAPLIALTYPIDKINDGSAQGFSVWLKEYMYNLLIQPFHILLYTIFITTAFSFAKNNPIYVCVVLGFLMPAEKLLRKMFNFNKSETASAFSGAAAGSMIASAISKVANKAKGLGGNLPKGPKDKGEGGDSGDKNDDGKFKDKTNDTEGFLNSGDNGNEDEQQDNIDDSDDVFAQRDKELADEAAKIDADEKRMKNMYEAAQGNELSDPASKEMIDAERKADEEKIAQRREALQKKLEENEAEKEKRKKELEEKKKKEAERLAQQANKEGDSKPKSSDKYKKGRAKALGSATWKAAKKRLSNPRMYANGAIKTLRFATGASVGAIGASVVGISSLAAGESPKEILSKAALGGTAGYALGTGGFGIAERATSATARFGTDIHKNYQSERYGDREADIREKVKSEKMKKYMDDYHGDLGKDERKEASREIAEYSTDTGVNDYKMIDKARDMTKSKELTEAEAKSLLVGASRYKADKPTGGMLTDEQREDIRKAMLRKFENAYTQKEKNAGNDVTDSKVKQKIKSNAQKAAKKYIDNFEKLL